MPELPWPRQGDLAGLQGWQQPPGQAAIGEMRLWVKQKLGWGGKQPGELGTGLCWVATSGSACGSGAASIAHGMWSENCQLIAPQELCGAFTG